MSSDEVCRFFLSGACRNGAACRFAHPGTMTTSSVPATSSSATTREMCKFYASASGCTYGDRCRYSHGDARSGDRGSVGVGGGMSAGATAFRPNGGGAWTNGPPTHVGGGQEDVVEEEWGYVDEFGNWVAFADECDEGANEFLAAQLPDEDEFLGMTSEGPTGDDSWGYFDEKGNWVSLEGDASAYLATQEDMVR